MYPRLEDLWMGGINHHHPHHPQFVHSKELVEDYLAANPDAKDLEIEGEIPVEMIHVEA